jgi:hypothetical protein
MIISYEKTIANNIDLPRVGQGSVHPFFLYKLNQITFDLDSALPIAVHFDCTKAIAPLVCKL